MSKRIFGHSQYGPYQQYAGIDVRDNGNGLPVTIILANDDPECRCSNSMSISQVELFHERLGVAIEAAKKSGIKDAGF